MSNRFFPNYDTYRVTSPFGMRTLNGTTKMHNGIDLVATNDGKTGRVDQLMAHTGGTVHSVGYNDSCGYYINISVDANTIMAYYHLREMSHKKKGDSVNTGEVIGYMGATGKVTGAHLHWGIKKDGNWINPAPYLDKDYADADPVEADFYVGMRILRKGCEGEDVRALQILLKYLGHYDGNVDGIYGPLTAAAVGKFQSKAGLEPDEVAGILTISALWGV